LALHLEKGRQSEQLALRYLRKQGLKLITKNFSRRGGELDLVMREPEKDILVIIEVRYRRNKLYGGAAGSIHTAKLRRIVQTTQALLQQHPQLCEMPVRFDVVALHGDPANPQIEWIKAAFGADALG